MKVAFLTSGGIAPCLSAAIGKLTEIYLQHHPEIEIIGYLNGYKGLLTGKSVRIPKSLKKHSTIITKTNEGNATNWWWNDGLFP